MPVMCPLLLVYALAPRSGADVRPEWARRCGGCTDGACACGPEAGCDGEGAGACGAECASDDGVAEYILSKPFEAQLNFARVR